MIMLNPFTVDHVYICIEKDKFEALKAEASNHHAIYKKYTPPDGKRGWEGLYIYTKEGTYFEILPAGAEYDGGTYKLGQYGIALSSRDSQFDTLGFCKRKFQDVVTGSRKTSDGKPWFSYAYQETSSIGALIWAMSYEGDYLKSRFNNYGNPTLEQISHVKIYTLPEFIKDRELFKDWLPESNFYSLHPVSDPSHVGYEIIY
jgi:hypothetical protein